jgi:hypothetical protein
MPARSRIMTDESILGRHRRHPFVSLPGGLQPVRCSIAGPHAVADHVAQVGRHRLAAISPVAFELDSDVGADADHRCDVCPDLADDR